MTDLVKFFILINHAPASVVYAGAKSRNQYKIMELSVEQQIFELLGQGRKVLIVLPEHLTADSVASGLALALFLKRLDKDVGIATSGKIPENLQFLPGLEMVKSDIGSGKSLVIVLDTAAKKLEELSYQALKDKVHIYLKSKDGAFAPQDVSFGSEKFPLDVIVSLDARSLESLGRLFEEHTDMFFETPKINIDNQPGNEYFGSVNLVDVTASSVAEILSGLFERFETQLVNEDIATCLLAGIITKTNSFQHVQTTPKAFLKASELISLGGRQQEVIKNVYKTKSLPLLKLWGRALARLKTEEEPSLAYSMLTAGDFEKAGAASGDLLAVLRELVDNTSSYKVLAILSETTEKAVKLVLAAHAQANPENLQKLLPEGAKMLEQPLGMYKLIISEFSGLTLQEAERRLLDTVQKAQGPASFGGSPA